MDRRRYLTALGVAATAATAGCTTGDDGDGGVNGNGEDGADGGATTTDGGSTTTTGAGSANGDAPRVRMVTEGSDYYFDPIGLFVEPGTEVTWVNESGAHSSTAWAPETPAVDDRRIPEGAAVWNSETLGESGAEFAHAPETQGTYDYYCIPHISLGMVGRLVVGEPGGIDDSPSQGGLPDPATIVEQGAVSYDEFSG